MLETIIKKIKKNKRLNRIKNKYPMLALNWIIKPLGQLRFKTEAKLYNGKEVASNVDSPSILFFTTHKCASTLIVKIIRELCLRHKVVPVDIDGYIITHTNNDKSVFNDKSFMKRVFKPKGFYYGAMRYFRTIPDMEKYKTFLMLRDPRDVITSMYFSIAFSHTVFNDKLVEKRKATQEKTIDEFVLESIPQWKKRYEDYINNVLNSDNTLFLKYEQMVADFPSFLNKMSKWLGVYDEAIINRLVKEISFESRKEDKHSHVRNVQPGDHLNKLKPETIEVLNTELKDVLTTLKYV
jgi:hypothetical protein